MARRQLLAAALLALLAGCSTVCDRDALPNHGDASTPEHLVELMLYSCKNHCWRTLYDHASEKTRDEYGYVKFRLGFPELKAPGRDEKVVDLVAASTPDVIAHYSAGGERYRLAYLQHAHDGETEDLNILLVLETDDDGKPEWKVALSEQVARKVAFTP
jgi:hypothetical protein